MLQLPKTLVPSPDQKARFNKDDYQSAEMFCDPDFGPWTVSLLDPQKARDLLSLWRQVELELGMTDAYAEETYCGFEFIEGIEVFPDGVVRAWGEGVFVH